MSALARVWHESDELRVGVAMTIGSIVIGMVAFVPLFLDILVRTF